MYGINSGSLFSSAHCVKSFHIGNTMDTFTIFSNFLIIAVVFIITCPDEGKGYWTEDWSDLDQKASEYAMKQFSKVKSWRTAPKREKMDTTTFNPNEILNEDRNEPPIISKPVENEEICPDPDNENCPIQINKAASTEGNLSVMPLNKRPANRESNNFERSDNRLSGFVLPSSRI